MKISYISALTGLMMLISSNLKAAPGMEINTPVPDSMKMLAEFSLFNEYYKNKDYKSAYEHGWNVLNDNPTPFLKWRPFTKMEDILWFLHDSTGASAEEQKVLSDTILYFYDLAMKYEKENTGYHLAKKGYVLENWVETDPMVVIQVYESALQADGGVSTFYKDRLGQLYAKYATEENGFKLKALDLYSKMSEEDPSNPTWVSRIESLAENIEELVNITYKSWQLEKDNIEKAWKFSATALRAKEYERAIVGLEFLVNRSPEVVNYWTQLASSYQKLEMEQKALEAYKKLIQLDPDNRDHYVNIALVCKSLGQLSTARNYLKKAGDLSPDWDYPVFIEGLLYEQAARECGFEFMDKCVYLLAQQTYARAKNIGGSFASQAQERMSALSGSVPTKEELFFRNIKSGAVIKIEGRCYDWIVRSVTIP